MTIVVECGVCGRRSGAKDEWVGRSVKCPGCGQKLLIPPPNGAQQPPAPRPAQARPAQARPAQALPAQPVAPGQRPQPPRQAAAAVGPDLSQPMAGGGILDLLGDDFGAAGAGALGGGQFGSPLGAPPKRRKKSGSNATLWIVFAAVGGVGALAICGGIVLALVLPAVQQARQAAQRVQAQRGGMSPAPSSGGLFGGLAPAAPTGPVWTSDANLAAQLPVEGTFDRYSMRLPAGFGPTPPPPTTPQPGSRAQAFMWMGQPQANGARQVVIAGIIDVNRAPRATANDLETALNAAMFQIRSRSGMVGVTNTPGERGQLAGKQFIRTQFSAIEEGIQINGRMLITIEGARLVTLFSMCNDSPGSPGYQLLDAALLTFKQR